MLFSGKENVLMCLAATKFVLRKINSGIWFIQIFLQKMLYMPNFPHTFSTAKHADNESIPHSFTEETKPSKKIHHIRSN